MLCLTGTETTVLLALSARTSLKRGGYAPYPLFTFLWSTGKTSVTISHNTTNQFKTNAAMINLGRTPFSRVTEWHEYRFLLSKSPDSTIVDIDLYIDGTKIWHARSPMIDDSDPAGSRLDFWHEGDAAGKPRALFSPILLIAGTEELAADITLSRESIRLKYGIDLAERPSYAESFFDYEPLPAPPHYPLDLSTGYKPPKVRVSGPGTREPFREYSSLSTALKSLPSEGGTLYLEKGIHMGPISIANGTVTLIGENANETMVCGYEARTNGIEGNSLFRCTGKETRIRASGITFSNQGARWNESIGHDERRGAALTLVGIVGATFTDCRFCGRQDTLYLKSGTATFSRCYIEGDVDIICGGATALFTECQVHALRAGSVYVTAPSPVNENGGIIEGIHGFYFDRCTITSDNPPDNRIYLARGPWLGGSGLEGDEARPGRSCVTFKDCDLGNGASAASLANPPWKAMDAPFETESYLFS